MITSAIIVLRPTAPGVAPGTAVLAGPAGASAYQLWLAAGNAGSTSDFLASLVGPAATAVQVQAAVQAILAQPGVLAQLLAGLAPTLPSADPLVMNAPWLNGRALTFSTGP